MTKKLIESNKVKSQLLFRSEKFNDDDFTIKGIFSTADQDRHGEVVDQKGWKTEEYMKNPVVLFAHDHYQPAIGQMVELQLNDKGELEGVIKFAAKEYDFANTIYQLYKGGFMRAFSVGFLNNVYEIDQENELVVLKENNLYEVSAVNVPANAMALAKSKGIDCTPLEKMFEKKKDVEDEIVAGKENEEVEKPVEEVIEEPKKETEKEPEEESEEKAVEVISKSNKETILAAIRTLTGVLKSAEEADIQSGNGRTPEVKGDGIKKIPVSLLNKAIRELVGIKKVIKN